MRICPNCGCNVGPGRWDLCTTCQVEVLVAAGAEVKQSALKSSASSLAFAREETATPTPTGARLGVGQMSDSKSINIEKIA